MKAAWGRITGEDILSPIRGTLLQGEPKSVLKGLSTDSRKIGFGDLFWALRGDRYDGHDFVEKAIESGAVGAVVEGKLQEKRFQAGARNSLPVPLVISVKDTLIALGDLARWWRRSHPVQVIGITGSTGKTTTKEMTASILKGRHVVLKNPGNLNNLVGLPLTLLQLEEQHDIAVLEMGMNRSGEIARLTEIAGPDVGLITNVGSAHVEGLGSREGIARAKVELVEGMPSTGRVILNGDDELLMKAAAPFRRDAMTFGAGKQNDLRAENVKNLGRDGVSFDLRYKKERWSIRLKVPGLQNVLNASAAAAVALCLHEPGDQIVEGLGEFEGIRGRFSIISLPGEVVLIDDTYNANPSSLKAALASLPSMVTEGGRLIVGLGEMLELGGETVRAHFEAGHWVAKLGAYHFVAIGAHAQEMIDGALMGGIPKAHAEIAQTHADMVKRIEAQLTKKDLVFLKGSRKAGLEMVVDGLRAITRLPSS